jgi:hypothetical protein
MTFRSCLTHAGIVRAHAALFLMSHESYVNAQALRVDGGLFHGVARVAGA